MGFTPVKTMYNASRTEAGGHAKAYRSIALLRLLARCFLAKKLIVQVNHSRLLCACCGFFVTAAMTHVIVVGM